MRGGIAVTVCLAAPERVRAFLAVPVGAPALGELRTLVERARAQVGGGVRWAPLHTAHVTLHFFGSITDGDAERAISAVRPVLAGLQPFQLRLAGLGSFPAEARARVLWIGVGGDTQALSGLAAGCGRALAAVGFPVESRPYRPHCTVGRLRSPWTEAAQGGWRLLAAEAPATSCFGADRAVLYQSLTGPSGAEHVPRVTVPLGTSC